MTFSEQFKPYVFTSETEIDFNKMITAFYVREDEREEQASHFLEAQEIGVQNIECPKGVTSCVYLISFKASRRVYVGSSSRWPIRGRDHLNTLQRGKHRNRYLQEAFIKYASKGISIECVEEIDPSLGKKFLLEREEYWIKLLKSANRNHGFNIAESATNWTYGLKRTPEQNEIISQKRLLFFRDTANKGRIEESRKKAIKNGGICAPKIFVLFDENDCKYIVYNLLSFCKERNLNPDRMYAVTYGRAFEYKGWRINPRSSFRLWSPKKEKRKPRIYKKRSIFNHREVKDLTKVYVNFELMSADGVIHKGDCIKRFCQKHSLKSLGSVSKVIRGLKTTYLGWRLPITPLGDLSLVGNLCVLISPIGDEITIRNLFKWCREHSDKINYDSLRKGRVSKGWRLKND